MRPLRRQICQWNEEYGCCCRKYQLKSQLPYSIDDVTISQAVDDNKYIYCHRNVHLNIDDGLAINPNGINSIREQNHNHQTYEKTNG